MNPPALFPLGVGSSEWVRVRRSTMTHKTRSTQAAKDYAAAAGMMATNDPKLLLAKRQTRYCGLYLPRKPIPAGRYLVHNQVRPVPHLGLNGFRAWTQKGRDNLVECRCDFGGCKN